MVRLVVKSINSLLGGECMLGDLFGINKGLSLVEPPRERFQIVLAIMSLQVCVGVKTFQHREPTSLSPSE